MALVLTRKLNETVKIGKDIFVTVALIKGDRVRLAVEAPPGVDVDRLEIAEEKAKSTEAKA